MRSSKSTRVVMTGFTAVLWMSVACMAHADAPFPFKPVRIVAGFSAGGALDFTARVIARYLSPALGQPVIVENKLGSGGMIAGLEVVRSVPDGHTLFVANVASSALAPNMTRSPLYDPVRDFTAIGQIVAHYSVIAVPTSQPANTLGEFVEWARKHPGKINYASGGIGSMGHLNGALLNQLTGLNMTHVAYKGAPPAVAGVMAGETHVTIEASQVINPQIKAGKLKAIAVLRPGGDPELPTVATVRGAGYSELETSGWHGLVGPAGMPKGIVMRLSAELKKILAMPDVRSTFERVGQPVVERGPEEFAAYVAAENERWKALIKASGARID